MAWRPTSSVVPMVRPPGESPAGHPHGEAIGVVVAAVTLLGHRCATELAAPDDECVVKQPAPFQVFEQTGDRPVHARQRAEWFCSMAPCSVPLGTGAAVESDEAAPRSTKRCASRQLRPKDSFALSSRPYRARVARVLGRQVDGLGGLSLHAEGESELRMRASSLVWSGRDAA